MAVVGIICEYNPFHKGHKYHIEKALEITGADTAVAIMSGNYVQRGDVAIFDKKLRAEAAIRNGIDLVLELPTVMSLCGAERFASCSVEILDSLNRVDYIAFGAESDDIVTLKHIAEILYKEPEDFKKNLAYNLDIGMPYAAARCEAVSKILPSAKEIMSSPNNILAIEYLKALIALSSPITPVLIKREGSGYNSSETQSGFISATGARRLISENLDLTGFVPDNLLPLYNDAGKHSILNMEKAIIANLCKMTSAEIAKLPDVSEGLENKIKKAAMECDTFFSLCDKIKSKRYAHSRIRRVLLHSFLGIKKADLISPQYIKILDFNEVGQKFLNKAKQGTRLPLVKNFNQIRELNSPSAENMWKNELLFDRIYDLF